MSAWENYHLEWSPDPLSVAIPTWQDITGYALARSGSPIHIQSGVPVMGSGAQAATMAVSLDNKDHRFTFGNTSSPLSPNWKPGRRIRCYETVGSRRVDLFSGYIQPPETDDWAEAGVDQYVTLTAIDRLGRLGTARTMISTLAEYIVYNGGPALVGYWTLLDSAGPTAKPAAVSSIRDVLPIVRSTGAAASAGLATFATAPVVPGDDLPGMTFTPVEDPASPGTLAASAILRTNLSSTVTVSGTDTLTLACWVFVRKLYANAQITLFQLTDQATGAVNLGINENSLAPGTWGGQAYLGSGSGTADPIGAFPVLLNQWNLVAVRMRRSPNVQELYVNGQSASVAATGSMPASFSLDRVLFLGGVDGYAVHAQVYKTSGSSDYTFAAHQAQYAAGLTGLYGQTTGQRIRTLAQYAGIPATELSNVDPGIAPMARATLAGQTPLAEMRVAETTEAGRLRTNGQGLLVFDPRVRRYNS